MRKAYYIEKLSHKGSVWALPKHLAKKFNLQENATVKLSFGSISITVQVITRPSTDKPLIGLSSEAIKNLHLPLKASLQVKAVGNNEFRLGPLIGILTFSGHLPNRLNVYRSYRNSASITKHNGFLYVFCGKDINVSSNTIEGYYYNHSSKVWIRGTFPFPDVVMNRLYPTPHKTISLLEPVLGPNKIFNKVTSISKIDFLQTLSSNNFLKDFIPHTNPVLHSSDLENFINKYHKIFLKPSGGMKGIGIIIVEKTPSGLKCSYKDGTDDIVKTLPSADDILKILNISPNSPTYIMQQAIECMEYQNGPFSFRTCPIKDSQNNWTLPGFVIIGTFGNSYITNYASGGKRIPLKEFFKTIIPQLPYSKNQLLQFLEELTIRTAAVLDNRFGPLGELGIDMVMDKQGKLWLLEANGNGARTPAYIQTEFPNWSKEMYKNLIGYAIYLAGFSD